MPAIIEFCSETDEMSSIDHLMKGTYIYGDLQIIVYYNYIALHNLIL